MGFSVKKKLEYEIIEQDVEVSQKLGSEDCGDIQGGDGAANLLKDSVSEAQAVPDRAAELKVAANAVTRVRYNVKIDYWHNLAGVSLLMMTVIIAFTLLTRIKNTFASNIVMVVACCLAVSVTVAMMIYCAVKSRRVHYCYYVKTDDGVFCMSVIDDDAVIFAYGTAYRISGDTFYTLDADGYCDYLDGECAGIVSALMANEVEYEDEDGAPYYFVKNANGGGHKYFIKDGKIDKIVSDQPYFSDEIDRKTGNRKIKLKTFEKHSPTDVFAVEVPAFVKNAFDDNRVVMPDLSKL